MAGSLRDFPIDGQTLVGALGQGVFGSAHQWIDVVTYRGFHDVPRVILAKAVLVRLANEVMP